MMVGEMDFVSMFGQDVTHTWIPPTFRVPYPAFTIVFFVLFVIFLPILFMNLLVGLAVDNIQSVQEKAVLERLAMQVRLNLDVERMLPTFLHRKYIIRNEEVYPNRPKSMVHNILNDNNNLRRIANSIVAKETDVSRHATFQLSLLFTFHSFQTEIEMILQKLNKVSEEVKKISQIDEMKEKLESIAKAMPGGDEEHDQRSAMTRSSTMSMRS